MNENEARLYLLGKENVRTALLKLGIPTMVGMLVSAFYNIVDAVFVGRLGTVETAAVSVIYPLTMVGTGIGLLFGNGAGSSISRFLGKEHYDKVKTYSSTAVLSGMTVITLVAAGLLLFIDPVVRTLGATQSSFHSARAYGTVFIIGLVFNVFNMMMNNLIVAEGASSYGMTAMLAGGCVNLVLDPILIFTCGLGVSGAAVATLVSRLVSTALYMLYLAGGKSYLSITFRNFRPDRSIYKEIVKIGLPICFFQFLTGSAVGITNVVAKPFGEAAIAAIGIVNRIMSLESNALYGFLKGYSPLVGYNYGAGDKERVVGATKTAICWSTGVNIIFGLLCILFARPFLYLFNQESRAVLDIGSAALRVDAVSFMTLGIQIVIGNYFLATGKAREGGMLSVCRQGLFFIPFLLFFTHAWGIPGLIFAQLAADICATLVTLGMGRAVVFP